jgi:Tol biopolymer transport system component
MNRFSKLLAAVGVIVIFAAVADGSTSASFPGANGRLIFVLASSSQIHSIYPDGTGLTNLGNGTEPTWSPDGTKVAYSESLYYNMDIFVMRADGSGKVNLTNTSDTTNPTYETQARWSPDGAKIAYYKSITQYTTSNIVDIWLMNADGTGQTNLTNTPPGNFELDPRWSPDGAKIAFTRNVDSQSTVWVMNVDGSGQIKDFLGCSCGRP